LMLASALRMAQLESSKEGEDAAGSEVMPTRQPFWSWSGEPRLVASKMTWGAEGADGTVLARAWGWAGAAADGAGGARWVGAWASNGIAPQTANHTAARTLNRKAPPDPAFFTLQPRGWKLKENCKRLILKKGEWRVRAERRGRAGFPPISAKGAEMDGAQWDSGEKGGGGRATVAEILLPIVAKRADTCV
jgi:hypothetical protein